MNTRDYSRIGRRLALALLAAAPLFAQCPTGTLYPGALDTNTSLTVAKNNIVTTLTVQQQIADTVLIVTTTTGWAANMMAAVDQGSSIEYEFVNSVTGMNTLNVTRACESTSAIGHQVGVSVANVATAYSGHTSVAGGLIAVETALGANLANIPGTASGGTVPINKGGTGQTTQSSALTAILGASVVPVANGGSGVTAAQGVGDTKVELAGTNSGSVGAALCNDANGGATTSGCSSALPAGSQTQYLEIQPNTGNNSTFRFVALPSENTADYNFPAQTPGGSLAVGANTVILTPCPLGVSGGATNLLLYISGGTGTAEAVLITGGTCTSGASTGNVTFSAANTHTGAWTIASASGGTLEAICALPSAGGDVIIPGNITLFANIGACGKTSVSVRKLAGATITGSFTILTGTPTGTAQAEIFTNVYQASIVSAPSWGSITGINPGFRNAINNFPANIEFQGNVTPTAVGVDGAVDGPTSNFASGAMIGVLGSSRTNEFSAGGPTGGPAAIGVFGASYVGVQATGGNVTQNWAANFSVLNCAGSTAGTCTDGNGFNLNNSYGVEIDVNMAKTAGAAAATNAIGLWVTGGSTHTPSGIADAIAVGYMGVGSAIPWKNAISIRDGASGTCCALYVGVSGTGNALGSQEIGIASRTAGGVVIVSTLLNDQFGNLVIRGGQGANPAQIVLEDGAGNIALQEVPSGSTPSIQITNQFKFGLSTFAALPAVPAAGFSLYCTNCTTAATCAGAGSGHLAVSNGTNWTCQ